MINKMVSGKLNSGKVWKMLVMLVIFSFSLVIAGCSSEEGPMEKAGKKMDEAVEETGDKLENAGEKVKDEMEEAVEETGDKLEAAGDKMKDGMKEAVEETGEMMEEAGNKMQEAGGN